MIGAERWQGQRIFLYRYPVDMRRQIDGLSALVATELGRHPADRCLYVFTNKGRDKIKLLIWHLNGYWLLYKRTEKQRFQWPDWFSDDTLVLSEQELGYLLDGYNLNGMRPHNAVNFAHAI
jgi:hypothetical protein